MPPAKPLEIEAKYALADAGAIAALALLRDLGPYRLEPAPAPEDQRNVYFDTADGRLAAARSGLRVREVGGRRIATVKTGGEVRGGLHTREEYEVELGAEDAPAAWPDSPARDVALALTGGAPLAPIVLVATRRHVVHVWRADSLVAELSLDAGAITAGGRELPFRELEIELRPGGDQRDVEALALLIAEHAPLLSEGRSKLARGLELLRGTTMADTDAPPAGAPPTLPGLALALLDATHEAHGLPRSVRRAALLAATAVQAARSAGADGPERAARDALLAAPDLLPPDELGLAAAAAALLREKPRPQREPALIALGDKDGDRALRLAALLRLADGLLAAGGIASAAVSGGATYVLAAGDAAPAEDRADLWRRAIGELTIASGDASAAPTAPPEEGAEAPPIPGALSGGEGAAEGARRVLRRFFERMLAREDGVRKGEDPEDVHQMRVATRRLRASLQVAEGLFDGDLIRRQRRGLRRIAEALGAVRDKDVFLASLEAHRAALAEDEQPLLAPLVAAVRAERAEARAALLRELETGRYARFRRSFAAFLTTPGAGTAPPPATGLAPRVRDVAGSAIWRRFEDLRAFEPALPGGADEALHAARIAGKRLRYTLEFFADALGPRAEAALAPLATLQETLGDLQDSVVARAHVRALGMEDDAGAQSYLAALEARRAVRLADLPRAWERATSATYRRRLLELVVKL